MGPQPSDHAGQPGPHPPTHQPALLQAPWQQQLRQAIEAMPASRRRNLRSFVPAEPAQLQRQGSLGAPPAPLLDLASNDYLGLSRHPRVIAAAVAELERSGLGAGASRLVCGSRLVHHQLEEALASWLGRERVLLFPSGFQANIAAVCALADRHSLVLADRLIHHSLLAGVRASGARLQRFRHNDLADLVQRLDAARAQAPGQRLLVLSESLFSMEGTSPDVGALAAICTRYGAALLLDEAHALGLLGRGGRGLGHGHPGLALISGTLGKSLGSGGAFVAGDALTIEWLLQSSGAFRYTTALAPVLAAGALAALEVIQTLDTKGSPTGAALLQRAARWRAALAAAGWPPLPGNGPILPLLVGSDSRALALQQQLETAGLLAVAIRPPTVPEGSARLRLVLRANLPPGTLERLISALGKP
jgi:8-amino-7-oxononanoate synthase